ncbi:CCA tRNA nucleotidyltransferase [Planococcus lenghuensis]|uniref:CCA tRNA nucleotidyltransferase n=2 Tax=Planococcus lenghuensis TaxID=2213202 RepID=A0A1Q2L3V1_9BACL|nr:CCA tRNA nucleotidyltransferase [Planococcus lenghuensis]
MEKAERLIDALEAAGFEAYIVGGAVRDLLLGAEPSDVDVATSALPEQVKAVFPRTVDTGIQHGTVLVLTEGEGIEVTTFRTESGYSDSRRPDQVAFVTSLTEDLRRRDFTINAMALTKDHIVVDPFGGQSDLDNRIIRAVGDADERFREDALRMLRAVRFAGQLGFEPEQATADSISRNADRIQAVAIERIKIELDKLFSSRHAKKGLEFLTESGLSRYLPAGRLFCRDWTRFPENQPALTGWAFMLHDTYAGFDEVRAYRFSNDERRLLQQILAAVREPEWTKWTVYQYTDAALAAARLLAGVETDLLRLKSELPIQSKSDLAVSGLDLLEWTDHSRGPWLREWLNFIEQRVVKGALANDKQQIKEWFLHEYSNHQSTGKTTD